MRMIFKSYDQTGFGQFYKNCSIVALTVTCLSVNALLSQAQAQQQINQHAIQQLQATGGKQLILDLGPATPPTPPIAAAPAPVNPHALVNPNAPRYVMGPNGQLILAPQMQPRHMQPYQPVRAQVMAAGQPTSGYWSNPNQAPRLAAHPQAHHQAYHDPRPTVSMTGQIPYQPYQAPQTVFAAPAPPRVSEPNPQPKAGDNVVYRSPLFTSTVKGSDTGADVVTKVATLATYGQQQAQQQAVTLGTPSYQPVALTQPLPAGQQARVVQLSGPSATTTSTVPAGQVLVPSNLQSSGPIIPPSVIPTPASVQVSAPTTPQPVASPDLFDDLTLNSIPEEGSLIDGIPDVGEGAVENFDDVSNDDGRFSIGLALNLNGIGAELADNYSALGSAFGASVDLGYKVTDNFVGRVQFTYDRINIDGSDFSPAQTNDLEGDLFSGYVLADWHPVGNGFRLTAGPGASLLELDGSSDNDVEFSPYVGLGYDSSLFSPSKFGVWADIGVTYFNDDSADLDFFPSANLGIKYRF